MRRTRYKRAQSEVASEHVRMKLVVCRTLMIYWSTVLKPIPWIMSSSQSLGRAQARTDLRVSILQIGCVPIQISFSYFSKEVRRALLYLNQMYHLRDGQVVMFSFQNSVTPTTFLLSQLRCRTSSLSPFDLLRQSSAMTYRGIPLRNSSHLGKPAWIRRTMKTILHRNANP